MVEKGKQSKGKEPVIVEVVKKQSEWKELVVHRIFNPKRVVIVMAILLFIAIITISTVMGRLGSVSDNTEVINQYKNHYEEVYTELSNYKEVLDKTQAALQEALIAQAEVISLKDYNAQLKVDINKLQGQLFAAVESRANVDKDRADSEFTVQEIQKQLDSLRITYNALKSKLDAVDAHTNETINAFESEYQLIFYDIWNAWWEADMVVRE